MHSKFCNQIWFRQLVLEIAVWILRKYFKVSCKIPNFTAILGWIVHEQCIQISTNKWSISLVVLENVIWKILIECTLTLSAEYIDFKTAYLCMMNMQHQCKSQHVFQPFNLHDYGLCNIHRFVTLHLFPLSSSPPIVTFMCAHSIVVLFAAMEFSPIPNHTLNLYQLFT